MKGSLILKLALSNGKTTHINITSPREEVTEDEIRALSDLLVSKKVFDYDGTEVLGITNDIIRKVDANAIIA